MMSRWKIKWLVLPFALLIAPAAKAQTASLPPDAQAALRKGLTAAKEQEWEIAIQSFQDARKIAPNAPELYYDLGLAESKIPGRELRAIAWFGAYLAANPTAPNAAAVRDFIAELQIKIEGNIDRLIKAVDVAGSALPDAAGQNRYTGLSTKADFDRVIALHDVVNLWAASGNWANAIQTAHRIGQAGYNAHPSLLDIAQSQAKAGYIADAIKTAASLSNDAYSMSLAKVAIAEAQEKTGDISIARATLMAARQDAREIKSVSAKNFAGVTIARAQASAGDISGAQMTVEIIPSPLEKGNALVTIAETQTKTGDFADAQKSLAIAQKSADLWNSLTSAQKVAQCNCDLSDPHDHTRLAILEVHIAEALESANDVGKARLILRIAQKYVENASAVTKNSTAAAIVVAQAKADDIIGAQETAKLITESNNAGYPKEQRDAMPNFAAYAKDAITAAQAKQRTQAKAEESSSTAAPQALPVSPTVSASDWVKEFNNLNTPLFLDLAGTLKAPQQFYNSLLADETESQKTFDSLVAMSRDIISEKNKIDYMLKQKVKQQAAP